VILYKYLPPERIDVLTSGQVRFTPPWMFNDPFEASPSVPDIDTEVLAELAVLQAEEPGMSEERRQGLIDKLQIEHFMRQCVLQGAQTNFGTLSLSGERDQILMWAHYTAQHTGFVIGFDTAHPAWVDLQSKLGIMGEPRKVTYAKTRPVRSKILLVTHTDMWYTKSDLWAYENEWRITRMLRTATTKIGPMIRTSTSLRSRERQSKKSS
jgi:hypothetical protein